jgi:hypothetical protein
MISSYSRSPGSAKATPTCKSRPKGDLRQQVDLHVPEASSSYVMMNLVEKTRRAENVVMKIEGLDAWCLYTNWVSYYSL